MSLKLSYKPYILKKKHPFRISTGTRTSTPILLLRADYMNTSGYGEASMPPLYGETIASAINFLERIELNRFNDKLNIDDFLAYVDSIDSGNSAVKASVDIAIHDLVGKLLGRSTTEIISLPSVPRETSKTIGIESVKNIKQRVIDAREFGILKIKLGARNDIAIINSIRSITAKPIYVDVNQGWTNKYRALDKIKWLNDHGVVFIEQPMPVNCKSEMVWLKDRSPLPLIGDEAVQRLNDLQYADEYYHGINIKLMKSTGLNEARKMVSLAKAKGLKILLGCMSETSCAISAGFVLASQADFIDLDGNLGITNDPFTGVKTINGILVGNNEPGIGLVDPEKAWDRIPK